MLGLISTFEKTVITPLAAAGQIPDLVRASKADSLIEYAKVTRVEPVTMVDQSILHLEFMPDVMQSVNSIFTGYYLQAVMLSLNVGSVDTIKLLDRVNPNRDPIDAGAMLIGDMFSEESYKYALPRIGKATGLEAYGDDKRSSAGSQKDVGELINNVTNLSVGKMIEIHVESGGHKAMIPAMVRLIVTGMDPQTLIHILADGSKDKSIKERFHGWRSGQLNFWRDLILCQDLIDDHRKALMKDSSGVYAATRSKRNKNILSAILSRNPSVATASNIVIINKSNAKELEREVGGKLNSYKTRQKIFESTYIMLMIVVDPSWEAVTIYHRGIEQPTELNVKQLKAANRGSGPDVSEILKAYQLGQAPSI